ncbi:MAG: hypothetical protein JJE51_04435 [Thermoanaerobaculia bacterium]|nr:hypothetical protein [Thermoanaerobaculia bacterium]
MTDVARELPRRVLAALLWVAAFCFATGAFLSSTLLLRGIPPTPHVAVGRVTIENVSKGREYLTAALFFVIVPAITIALFRLGARVNERLRRRVSAEGVKNLVSLAFILPFFLAPFLYLTTFKWGWPLLVPLLLQIVPLSIIAYHRNLWIRRLLRGDLLPYHTLILTYGMSWILFRYLAASKRIAHIPTLFLELAFIAFFLFATWAAFVAVARLASFLLPIPFDTALCRLSLAGLPLLTLPLFALFFIPGWLAASAVLAAVMISIIIALSGREVESPRRVRAIAAYIALPLLLYCFSYGSTVSLAQWIDLFHRGESLGPASDYLRGKAPYTDVFVLHGLLHDGMLDAWLMQWLGRDIDVALARPALLGSLAAPAFWYLGMAIFNSIPLSILLIFLGAVTTVDNERILFELATLALLLAGTKGRTRPLVIAAAGAFAAAGLFFSFDIGLYAMGGAAIFLVARGVMQRDPGFAVRGILSFAAGLIAGALPFVLYLTSRGAFGAFLETSFVTLPRIIDAIWSLPFPDLTTTFRENLNLHTISNFLLFEHFRFILNPLVIVISILCLAERALRRRSEWLDVALLALTAFAILTQRSALGRADFPHQYFSAFLIGPMILILLIMMVHGASEAWRSGGRLAQSFLLLAGVAIFPLLMTALWVPDIINMRIDDLARYVPRVKKFIRDPLAVEIQNRIEQVRYHVYDMTPKGGSVFDFSNQPALYFFLNRPNPTRFYQVPIMSPPEFQREAIVDLERAKPPVVIRRSPQEFDVFDGIDNAIRAQAVAAYIDDNYEYARSVRGVELWQRKRGLRRFDIALYMRHIRIPTLKELNAVGARTRLVFPAVASTPGATGNFWRSDLMLHNPFEETMGVDLRYVAGDTRIDRRITLGPRRSIRFEDVVKTLFRAPDSGGVLWIEYRGERGPVARVKTYDATRNAGGAVESPLSLRDSATAGTDRDDLTVIGIPGGGVNARRVNAGVVNVGNIPVTFRIEVRRRDGRQVGKAIEQGLAEDESSLITGVEQRMGVEIDENSTLHVTMIAGTAIAYASVVESDSDTYLIAGVPSPKP